MSSTKHKTTIFDLPVELRDEIYHHVLIHNTPLKPSKRAPNPPDSSERKDNPAEHSSSSPASVRPTLPIFYGHYAFVFDLDDPKRSLDHWLGRISPDSKQHIRKIELRHSVVEFQIRSYSTEGNEEGTRTRLWLDRDDSNKVRMFSFYEPHSRFTCSCHKEVYDDPFVKESYLLSLVESGSACTDLPLVDAVLAFQRVCKQNAQAAMTLCRKQWAAVLQPEDVACETCG